MARTICARELPCSEPIVAMNASVFAAAASVWSSSSFFSVLATWSFRVRCSPAGSCSMPASFSFSLPFTASQFALGDAAAAPARDDDDGWCERAS